MAASVMSRQAAACGGGRLVTQAPAVVCAHLLPTRRVCTCQAEASTSAPSASTPPAKRPRGRPRKNSATPPAPPPPESSQPQPPAPAPQAPRSPPQPTLQQRALQDEIAMQEQEAELGLDDIVQMQYEVPTDEEIEQDVKDVIEEEGLQPPAAAPSPQGGVAGAPGPESVTGLSRKAAILLEIIAAASGADLDSKIAQFVDDIDEELLQLLQTRIDMVTKVSLPAAEHLREIQGVLKVVYMRKQASPEQRLLDDVLDILGDDMANTQGYASKRLEAMARIREAFQGGAGLGLDIFAAAAALAEAGPVAAAELASEAVDPLVFITETTQVLDETKRNQQQLGAQIDRAQKEIAYLQKNKPEMLQGQRAMEHMAQLNNARRVHAQRAVALGQLQDIITMARQVMADKNTITIE